MARKDKSLFDSEIVESGGRGRAGPRLWAWVWVFWDVTG